MKVHFVVSPFKIIKRRDKKMKRLIETLVGIPSACGHEQDVIRYLRDQLCSSVDSWEIDGIGNLIVKKEGGKPGPVLMVSAHSDEVGFIVKKIEESGLIRADLIMQKKFVRTQSFTLI